MLRKSFVLVALFSVLFASTPVLAISVPSGEALTVRFKHPLNSKDLRTGDVVMITVEEDLVVDGQVVFKAGAEGKAYVEKSKGGRAWGRGGYLYISDADIKDIEGVSHSCSLNVDRKGDGKSSGIILPIIGAVILWPLIFFGFKKGDPAYVSPGTSFTAIVS